MMFWSKRLYVSQIRRVNIQCRIQPDQSAEIRTWANRLYHSHTPTQPAKFTSLKLPISPFIVIHPAIHSWRNTFAPPSPPSNFKFHPSSTEISPLANTTKLQQTHLPINSFLSSSPFISLSIPSHQSKPFQLQIKTIPNWKRCMPLEGTKHTSDCLNLNLTFSRSSVSTSKLILRRL